MRSEKETCITTFLFDIKSYLEAIVFIHHLFSLSFQCKLEIKSFYITGELTS